MNSVAVARRSQVFLAFAAFALLFIVSTRPVVAQSINDWGSSEVFRETTGESVSFISSHAPGEIVVSLTDRRLYLITTRDMAISYPIATPRDEDRWEGSTTITGKKTNPSWMPTPTMIAENPRLPRWIPGGHPMNPLGARALYLGSGFYRIHGTDAPWSIGTASSQGCFRMANEDVVDLYSRVLTGAPVTVTGQRFAAAFAPS